ncbi:MAG: hypothetical protein ACI4EO_01775, partial [Blautia sp.]
LTPEYISMHDHVVNLAEQVEADAKEVREANESVSAIDLNVKHMQEQIRQSAESAEQSKENAAGYAESAELSRQAAETAEQNVNAQVSGFDSHVLQKTTESEKDIEAARITANKAILTQQEESIQYVKEQTSQYISDQESQAKTNVENYTSEQINNVNQVVNLVKTSLQTVINDATTAKNEMSVVINDADNLKNELNNSVSTAVTELQNVVESAEQVDSEIRTSVNAAKQAATDANAAAQSASKAAEEAKQAAASVRDDCYPMMFREYDGRVYSVFFADADETMVCTGTKEDDNADIATPVPSTNAVRNENPYDNIPLFKPIECNGYVDADGELHITAVKGEPEFREDGSKGDVCIALKTGYIRTIVDTVGIMGPLGKKGTKISVTDSWRESEYPGFPFIPYTSAIRPDATVRPYVMIPKYQAVSFNGSYYSLPGFAPAYNISHNNQISTFQKRGTQYCGETCSDAEIWETLFMIVFANMNSQAVMAGCTNFSAQYMAAVAEENVERIILTQSQAEYFPIGSCVSIGEMGTNTNKDRSYAYMHNLANRVKVTKIEALDDESGNYALYVDNGGVTFNTTTTTCISAMPWHTGSTNNVKGTCGSPYSNTNGKDPFKFLGIEFALGQYVVRADVILNGVYDSDADLYQQEIYTCYDCQYFATSINAHYKKLGYVIPDSGNAWKYIKNLGFDVNFPHIRMASEYGGDSNKRWGDAVHTGTRANGTRGFLSLGYLWNGSLAGLRFAGLYVSLGNVYWNFSARPSFTGRRGSVVDWATAMGVNLAA